VGVVTRGQVSEPGRLPSERRALTPNDSPRQVLKRRRVIVDVCAALAGLGFGAVLAAVILGESRGSLAAPGGLLSAAGRLAGFSGTYLMLIMVVLVARLPWLERSVGQDQLVRWHRQIAPWAIGLIIVHVAAIVLGYARAVSTGPWHELWVLLTSYRDILAATVGFGLLIMAGISSYRYARRRLRYETWWVIHLYLYLGLALAFAHQIFTGVSFIGHPLVRALWIVVWAATAGMVVVYRIAQPVWRSLRHRLRVVEVRPEAPGVVSVVCRGRHLDRLEVSGGQFFLWHFLARELWWQGHPYSLSALPQPPYIRVTIKGLGDQSQAAASLRPGTWVAIEGPYGAFTHHARIRDGVALFAAGVGITPVRALLEDLPSGVDVVVVVRASTAADLVHRDEVATLVKQRGGRLQEIVGSRHKVRLNARNVRSIVPDIAYRDVYICGPDGFSAEIAVAAQQLGAWPEQIHTETFGF
jgi:predicted ferric reductase